MHRNNDEISRFKPTSNDTELAIFFEGSTQSANLTQQSAAQKFEYPDDYINEKNHINEKYFPDELLKQAVRLRNKLIDLIKGTFFTSRIAAEAAQKDFWSIVLNSSYKERIQKPDTAKSNEFIKQHIAKAEDTLGDRYHLVKETTSCCRRRKTESGDLIEKLKTDMAPIMTVEISLTSTK